MRITNILPLAALALLVGCGFNLSRGNVPAKLNLLEQKFGVKWPTRYENAYGGSLTDDRGGSVILVRMEITKSDYLAWRQSATNILHDAGFATPPPEDPKLERYFPWWDCSSVPSVQGRLFDNEIQSAKGLLFVYAVPTNNNVTMYIDGTP
ncbi:MAG TPA: hypothetical protein VH280_09675 [Verrucomicrobiae bacterium]|jgi:hypothetical protein|nr:hypothetical protein [Verrucomicrobiae bacterium]